MPYFIAVRPPGELSGLLRRLGGFDAVGHHITVKAQPGLEDELRGQWLPSARKALSGFGSFALQLGSVSTFDDSVAFLEVDADEVYMLHRRLMESVNPPVALADRFFELEDWHPHLTVRQGRPLDLAELRVEVASLGRLPSFSVQEVWVCRQDASGAATPEEAISLL